ncbi:MAG: SAM-dependent methyltransferase [Peptostreptococcaceae bacterium]|nr:SAM-dependent methyltransferase [Peptostreptococcaceae bacterium]
MKLDPRLQAIAEYVKKGESVADIGTDHGYIPIYLAENGISSKVFATDVNKGPLNNAKGIVKTQGFEEIIVLRLGNGLAPVIGEKIDKIIIAGMGGLLIRDILISGEALISRENTKLILQPMVAQSELRTWLKGNGFRIISERLARDKKKFYEILLVEMGVEPCDNLVYDEIGSKLLEEKDPLLKAFVSHKIRKYEIILDNITQNAAESELMYKKAHEIIDRIEKLKEVLEKI